MYHRTGLFWLQSDFPPERVFPSKETPDGRMYVDFPRDDCTKRCTNFQRELSDRTPRSRTDEQIFRRNSKNPLREEGLRVSRIIGELLQFRIPGGASSMTDDDSERDRAESCHGRALFTWFTNSLVEACEQHRGCCCCRAARLLRVLSVIYVSESQRPGFLSRQRLAGYLCPCHSLFASPILFTPHACRHLSLSLSLSPLHFGTGRDAQWEIVKRNASQTDTCTSDTWCSYGSRIYLTCDGCKF